MNKYTLLLICLISLLTPGSALSQVEESKETLIEKQRKEISELRAKHKEEKASERKRKAEERKRKKEEKIEERKRKKQEADELRKKEKKAQQEIIKNKFASRAITSEGKKEIKQVKRAVASVEIVSNEEDPIHILDAKVAKAKTKYLKLKDVDLNYKLKIENQTPKIITTASIIWERMIPFDKLSTLKKETKVSKPLIPYEKRTVEYNDIDSIRQGEIYRVKISKVIFKDGSQWKNPL